MKLILSTLIITAGVTVTLCTLIKKSFEYEMAKIGFEQVLSEQKDGNVVLWQKPNQTLMLKMPAEFGELLKQPDALPGKTKD